MDKSSSRGRMHVVAFYLAFFALLVGAAVHGPLASADDEAQDTAVSSTR